MIIKKKILEKVSRWDVLNGIMRIPKRVTRISCTFSDIKNLEHIIIPNTVTYVHININNCPLLKEITLPNSVTKLYVSICDCESLERLELPSNILSIQKLEISRCQSMGNILFPNTITRIKELHLTSCGKMTHVILPDTLKRIWRCTISCGLVSEIVMPSPAIEVYDVYISDKHNLFVILVGNCKYIKVSSTRLGLTQLPDIVITEKDENRCKSCLKLYGDFYCELCGTNVTLNRFIKALEEFGWEKQDLMHTKD